jgi:hypothetical protein
MTKAHVRSLLLAFKFGEFIVHRQKRSLGFETAPKLIGLQNWWHGCDSARNG